MAELRVKRLADFRTAPVGKVIKADAYARLVSADAAIAAAEQEARALFEKTRQAALREAEREAEQARREQHLEFTATVVDFLEDLEQRVAELVAEGVRRVIGRFEPAEAMTRMIGNLLSQLRAQNRVTLEVSPDSLDAVSARFDELQSAHPTIEHLELVVDPSLPGSVCRLQTPLSTIQTSVDEQIELLRSALSVTRPAAEDHA